MHKFILVNGYGWTGSGVVLDILKECEGVFAPDFEFRIIKDPDGLIDLDQEINQMTDLLNVDYAIKKFKQMIDFYARKGGGLKGPGCSYDVLFKGKLKEYSDAFIESITWVKYKGYWGGLENLKDRQQYFKDRIKYKIGICNYQYETDMYLPKGSEEYFVNQAKLFLESVFNAVTDEAVNIALDQAIPVKKSWYADRYFENNCVIVVDRDPRDVFINLIKREALVGYDSKIKKNADLFIEWYRQSHVLPKQNAKKMMFIRYEDILFAPEDSVERILDFCEISSDKHIFKGKWFCAEKSMQNYRIWEKDAKYTEYFKEIDKIQTGLQEFIYEA